MSNTTACGGELGGVNLEGTAGESAAQTKLSWQQRQLFEAPRGQA